MVHRSQLGTRQHATPRDLDVICLKQVNTTVRLCFIFLGHDFFDVNATIYKPNGINSYTSFGHSNLKLFHFDSQTKQAKFEQEKLRISQKLRSYKSYIPQQSTLVSFGFNSRDRHLILSWRSGQVPMQSSRKEENS